MWFEWVGGPCSAQPAQYRGSAACFVAGRLLARSRAMGYDSPTRNALPALAIMAVSLS